MERVITLRADHGAFVCAEEGGGYEGQTVPVVGPDGTVTERPAGMMTANRYGEAGAWESITVRASGEPGIVGLVSCDYGGRVACCENAEADQAAGRSGVIVFRSDAIGAWEKFRVWDVDGYGARVAFESVARPGWFIKAWPDGRVSLDQPMANDRPCAEPGGYETFVSDPPLFAAVPAGLAAIVGQLRVTDRGFEDDNGPVLPIGIHVGDLFSLYTRDEQKARDTVARIAGAGYALVQFWLNLGSLGGDYWEGREIGPEITPDYWGALARFSDLLDAYGMKGIYCMGDYALRGSSHADFAHNLGALLAGRDTGALVIAGNEAWQTGADSIETLQAFLEAFREVCGDVPITTTAPPTEHGDDIAAWCDGDYYAIHGFRDGEDHDRIRHIFSVPWEGNPPARYGFQDEPTGPGDEVSVKARHCYEGRDVDAFHLCALAAQALICDQGYNFFCSDGIKLSSPEALAAWPGFAELPYLLRVLPPDLHSWPGPFHFGDSQRGSRIFAPKNGNAVRMDCRIADDGRIVGLLYGDNGEGSIVCERACQLLIRNWNGEVLADRVFAPGDVFGFTFVRSEGGQPGRTCFFVSGQLA